MYKKILIVEDEDELRKNIARLVKILGFIPDEAYTKIVENEYDLVISDIKMPVMDGYNLLLKVRNNEMKKHIQFIFLTSTIELNDIRKAMILGADDYVTKPFDNQELAKTIRARLERAGELSEFYRNKFQSVIK